LKRGGNVADGIPAGEFCPVSLLLILSSLSIRGNRKEGRRSSFIACFAGFIKVKLHH
jgi:hypothetical protein